MTNVQELPGYYFDQGKNRYFKIEPGQVPPSSSLPKPCQKQDKSKPLHVNNGVVTNISNNICSILKQRECWKFVQKKIVLETLTLESNLSMIEGSNSTKYAGLQKWRSHYGCSLDISPSRSFRNILCQSFSPLIKKLECIKMQKGVPQIAALPLLNGFTGYSMSYTFVDKEETGALFTYMNAIPISMPPELVFIPNLLSHNRYKREVRDVPYACASNFHLPVQQPLISHSSNRHAIIVKDVEIFFSNLRRKVEYVICLPYQIRSQCFSQSLLFNGLIDGSTHAVDCRCKKKILLNIGSSGGPAIQLHVTTDERILIARHSTQQGDLIRVWDIRNPQTKLWDWECQSGSYNHNRPRSSSFFVCRDSILSCMMSDRVFRMWNVQDGQLCLKSSTLKSSFNMECGMYTDSCGMFSEAPGIFGCSDSAFYWLPL